MDHLKGQLGKPGEGKAQEDVGLDRLQGQLGEGGRPEDGGLDTLKLMAAAG